MSAVLWWSSGVQLFLCVQASDQDQQWRGVVASPHQQQGLMPKSAVLSVGAVAPQGSHPSAYPGQTPEGEATLLSMQNDHQDGGHLKQTVAEVQEQGDIHA